SRRGHEPRAPCPRLRPPNDRAGRLDIPFAVDDAPACEVVRRELDLDLVSDHDPDPELPHLAAGVGEHLVMTIVEDHAVGAASEGRVDPTDDLDCLFLDSDNSPPDTATRGHRSIRAALPRRVPPKRP